MRALLAIAALLAAAPAAGAATVRVGATGAVDYAAGAEANALTVSAAGAVVTVRDDAATVTTAGGCTAASAHVATCTVSGFPRVSAQLGDGDDRATVAVASAVLDGGAGADALTGGEAADVLEGGSGDDVLDGGGGDDTLYGDGPGLATAGGADRLTGGPGDDTLDCGPGEDRSDGDAPGCENAAPPPAPAAPPEATPVTEQAPAGPADPGVIVPLAAPRSAAQGVVPIALTVRSATAIRRATLRRTGLRVAVSCSMVCRPTLALRRGTRTLARRTIATDLRGRTARLRARTTAGVVTLRVTVPDAAPRTKRIRVR